MREILFVINITKTYRNAGRQRKFVSDANTKKKALNNLSFTVSEGEIYGLLGPNGAGKTTAMRIISTLIKSDSGDVLIAGDSVKDCPLKIRRKIGFLSGDLKLDEFFTPAYLFDFFAAIREVPKVQARERREQLFNRFGIEGFAHKKFKTLSSGMKQKVSFVVSIAHDPLFIIFDEPTNGMDLLAARAVSDFLLELKKEGKTIILATHIFTFAEKICDRAAFIIDGRMLGSVPLKGVTGVKSLEDTFLELYHREE